MHGSINCFSIIHLIYFYEQKYGYVLTVNFTVFRKYVNAFSIVFPIESNSYILQNDQYLINIHKSYQTNSWIYYVCTRFTGFSWIKREFIFRSHIGEARDYNGINTQPEKLINI